MKVGDGIFLIGMMCNFVHWQRMFLKTWSINRGGHCGSLEWSVLAIIKGWIKVLATVDILQSGIAEMEIVVITEKMQWGNAGKKINTTDFIKLRFLSCGWTKATLNVRCY